MSKKIIFLLGICFVLNSLQAQENNVQTQEESYLTNTWTLGFSPIGGMIIGEFPVSQKSTFRVSAGSNLFFLGADIEEEDVKLEYNFSVSAHSAIGYRYYYKLKKADLDSKRLVYNSGNFFTAQLTTFYQLYNGKEKFERSPNPSSTLYIGWGYQRMYKNKFVFSFDIGPGISLPRKQFALGSSLTLGIRLNKNK